MVRCKEGLTTAETGRWAANQCTREWQQGIEGLLAWSRHHWHLLALVRGSFTGCSGIIETTDGEVLNLLLLQAVGSTPAAATHSYLLRRAAEPQPS